MVWYSHLFQNFSQFIVIHTIKGFGIVNKAEIDVFLELSCFFDDPADVGNLISGSSAFSKTSLTIWKFTVHDCWSLAWRILSMTLLACEMSAIAEIPGQASDWADLNHVLVGWPVRHCDWGTLESLTAVGEG